MADKTDLALVQRLIEYRKTLQETREGLGGIRILLKRSIDSCCSVVVLVLCPLDFTGWWGHIERSDGCCQSLKSDDRYYCDSL